MKLNLRTQRSLTSLLMTFILVFTQLVFGDIQFSAPWTNGGKDPLVRIAPLPASAATQTFTAGAYIVDMGQPTQTIANGLKPYGFIFDLIVNKAIPVKWAIEPSKTKDGVDFIANGKSYKGSAFIIPAEFATAAAATIATWKAQGVVIDGPISSSFSAPIYDTITSFPNAVLDLQKGSIVQPYFTNAGIPQTTTGAFGSFNTYRLDYPSGLNSCDDMYIMPHADPAWATHKNLIPFNQSKGFIWAGCHAVSVLESLDDPADADTLPNMNFLSTNTGLLNFGKHSAGSLPYTYNPATAADPIMQFMGTVDGSQENGSEQIYMPNPGSAWRPETTLSVTDTTQANVPLNSPGPAAKLAYGPGFGNSSNGLVFYEGGHSINGTSPAYVSAQRAFFNFILLAGIARRVNVTPSIPSQIGTGQTVNVSANASGGSGLFSSYQWYSDCGGTFANPTAGSTTFTAPATGGTCSIRVVVRDSCNRKSFGIQTTIIAGPSADLGITQTDNQTSVIAGSPITYTITVTNNGPDTVNSVKVTDTVPATILSPTFTPSTGTYNSSTGDWTGLNLAKNQSVTLTLKGTVSSSATGSLVNKAMVAPPTGFTDPVSTNNSNDDTDTITKATANLTVTKTDNQTQTTKDNSISYTITVTNSGPSTVNSLTVTDTISDKGGPTNKAIANEVFTPSVGTVSPTGPTFSGSGVATFTWSGLNLAPGQSATFTLSGKVGIDQTKSPLTNQVAVAPAGGVTGSSASATDVDTVIAKIFDADLAITKTHSPTSVIPGNPITYTLAIKNNGPDPVTSMKVTDTVPAIILSPSFTPSTGTYNSATGDWTGINLASGATINLTLTGTVDSAATGTLSNTATVSTPAGVRDGNFGNNDATDSFTLTAPQADLSITNTDNQTNVAPGDTVNYTIMVKNNGPSTVNSLKVTDPISTNLLSPSFTASTGTYNSSTGNWTGLNLAPGQSITLTLSGTVNTSATGILTHTATVAPPTGVTDPVSTNNSSIDSDTITPTSDLIIQKTDDQTSATAGSPITYTLTVTNNGPSKVTSVTVTDTLPTTILSPTYTPSTGTYNSSTGAWTGLNLTIGQSVALTLSGTVSISATGNLSNTAMVAPPAGFIDPNTANNSSTDTDTITPASVDLGITITDGKTFVAPGSPNTYTITVKNNGPNIVTSAKVIDTLPAAILSPTYTPSAGTYKSSTGNWTGLNLAPGQSMTLTLSGTVSPSVTGNLVHSVTVVPPAGYVDPNSSNDSSTDTDATGAPTQSTDLSITNTDNQTSVAPEDAVTYTITVTNNGPTLVDSVFVTDTVPSTLLVPTFSSPDGTYDSDTGEWTNLNLAPGQSATLLLDGTVSALASGTLANTATVAPPVGFGDSNSANNSATDTDTVIGSSLPSGIVWNDLNFNGIRDSGEPGVGGVTVKLFDTSNVLKDTAVTDTTGHYTFANPSPGNYYLEFESPSGYVLSRQDLGGDNLVDSDANPFDGRTITTNAPNGEPGNTWDAGIARDTDGDRIPDVVDGTGDRDGDGIPNYQDIDPAGYFYDEATGQVIPGGKITVTGPGGIKLPFDGSSGYYEFFVNIAGTYTMSITPPPGYAVSTTCALQSTPPFDPTGGPDPTLLGAGKNDTTGLLTSKVCTPSYLSFDLSPGDPFVLNNNIALKSLLAPKLSLVKRITAINASPITTVVDPTTTADPNDNEPYWPANYLRGAIDGGIVKPNDELEYTIYFLFSGDVPLTKIAVCDLVPANSTFSPSTFNGLTPTDGGLPGADSGMELAIGPTTTYLSNAGDTDRGQFFATGTTPSTNCSGANTNGAVVVNIVTGANALPNATAPGTPNNSYGFIRFRAKVK